MQRKGSIQLPVLIGLFIISLLAAGAFFYLYQDASAQNVKLKGQLVELEGLQKETSGKLDESKKLATDLSLKLQEAKSKLDSLSNELTEEKSAHAQTSAELEQLKTDLSKQKASREDLENQLNQVQNEGKQIKEQIKIMQQQKASLEEKIKNLESGTAGGVELGKVVVNPEQVSPGASAPAAEPKVFKAAIARQADLIKGAEGKVLIVNKEFNFVVINLGSKDKIKVGDEFTISRAGKAVGEIKVEKVHEAMAAAGFAAELKDLIRENDLVTQKLK